MAKSGKWISQLTYNPPAEIRYEYNTGEVVVVEGDAMTIQELFARHVNGHNPGLEREVYYEDTEDFNFPDLSKINQMDLFERSELFAEVEARAKAAREAVQKAQREADRAEARTEDEKRSDKDDVPSKGDGGRSGGLPPEDSTSTS